MKEVKRKSFNISQGKLDLTTKAELLLNSVLVYAGGQLLRIRVEPMLAQDRISLE